jgi:hypothetical protein
MVNNQPAAYFNDLWDASLVLYPCEEGKIATASLYFLQKNTVVQLLLKLGLFRPLANYDDQPHMH